jgi:large subunit ribosomal protein L24
MANLNVKKGDSVMVITGNDKGKSGKIITVNTAKNRVTIEGLNMVSKCIKAKNAQEKGGIVKQPAGIDVSNVMPICPSCGKPTRVGAKIETVEVKDVKKRICKKCGADLDAAPEKAAKTTAKKTTAKKTATKTTAKTTTKKAAAPKAEKAVDKTENATATKAENVTAEKADKE